MADYTTPDDVRSYYMGLITASDYVTEVDIERFISESSLKIDLTLQKKYVLPFADATDLNYIKLVCEKMVVCKIDKIFRVNSTEDEDTKFIRSRAYCKEAKEMMDELLSGAIDLNATQKSYRPIKYNKTEVPDAECFCN